MQEPPTTVLGLMHVEIYIPMCRSLKEKRGALRPPLNHLRTRFNLAVSEVGEQDTWTRSIVALATVSNDRTSVENRLRETEEYFHSQSALEVRDVAVEIL